MQVLEPGGVRHDTQVVDIRVGHLLGRDDRFDSESARRVDSSLRQLLPFVPVDVIGPTLDFPSV